MRHYSLWPVLEEAACGALEGFKTTELALVDCDKCRHVVVVAELLGKSA